MDRVDAGVAGNDASSGWRLRTKVAFRFCVVYFVGFCLLYVQIMFVFTGVLGWVLLPGATMWQLSVLAPVIEWVGQHVFCVNATLDADSNSGDRAAMWVFVFMLLVVSAAATAIWSIAERRFWGVGIG